MARGRHPSRLKSLIHFAGESFPPSRGAESAEWGRSGRAWATCAGGRGAFGIVDFADRIELSSRGEGNSLQNLREMRHLCVAAMPHNLTEMNSCAAKG